MAYRQYNGSPCQGCGREQGLLEGSGRERRYCSAACRQAAYRQRREANRNTVLLRNSQLETRWSGASITGTLLDQLRTLYIAHGEAAASLATDAVLLACQNVRTALNQRGR